MHVRAIEGAASICRSRSTEAALARHAHEVASFLAKRVRRGRVGGRVPGADLLHPNITLQGGIQPLISWVGATSREKPPVPTGQENSEKLEVRQRAGDLDLGVVETHDSIAGRQSGRRRKTENAMGET